ncbi:MAG: CPBP family glutamic-type intramembrane protease [Byssovorax sp.]
MTTKTPGKKASDGPAPEKGKPRPIGTPLVELGMGLAWLLGTAAALQAAEMLFSRFVMAVAIAGAVVADVASTWAGVRWDEGEKRAWKDAVGRLAAGAGVAAAVVFATFAAGAALGRVDIKAGAPSIGIFLVVLRCAAVAVRDELIFRGIPLVAAARAGVPALVARGFAALASTASMASLAGVSAASLVLGAASGWLFATLWQRDRGAWSAVGAHAAWTLLTGALLRGGIVDMAFKEGNFGLGPRASGAPAWIAAAVAVVAAVVVSRRPASRVSS